MMLSRNVKKLVITLLALKKNPNLASLSYSKTKGDALSFAFITRPKLNKQC